MDISMWHELAVAYAPAVNAVIMLVCSYLKFRFFSQPLDTEARKPS